MSASKTTAPTKRAPARRATAKATPPAEVPQSVMNPEVVSRVTLGDSREVRITRIPNGSSDHYIRVGINLLPNGQNMSGAVFPASYLDDVIAALRKAG